MQFSRLRIGASAIAFFAPKAATAATLSYADIFSSSAPSQKFLFVGLALASLVCITITIRKMLAPELTGGSPFISGLRFAGPTAGVFGCAYAALRMSVGITTLSVPLTTKLLAPAFAEMAAMIAVGFSVGVIAVASQWFIEHRIEREILAVER